MILCSPNYYLNPQSRHNNGPNPLNIAQKAIILHTLGVQVTDSLGASEPYQL